MRVPNVILRPSSNPPCLSFSRLCTDVSVLSLEFAGAGARVDLVTPAPPPPPTSDNEPPDDVADDRSCTSYRDSCELILVSRLDRLLFFSLNCVTFNDGWLAAASFGGGSRAAWCCSWISVQLPSNSELAGVLTIGAVLIVPLNDRAVDEGGEFTIRSKLSSAELIDIFGNCALSIESMLLLMDEQQLSSIVEECARVVTGLMFTPVVQLLLMNRFTSRSGLSIDVVEMRESFNVLLLVEGNRVCLDFGVDGTVVVAVNGCGFCGVFRSCDDCVGLCCCGACTGDGEAPALATVCDDDELNVGELTYDDKAGAELLPVGGIRPMLPIASGDGDTDEDDTFDL